MKHIFLILCICSGCLLAQSSETAETLKTKFNYGGEVDLLPFINHGYYASGLVGNGPVRARVILTHLTSPSFVVPDGFENLKTTSYTLLCDYFLNGKNPEKWWLGGGLEYWRNEVQNADDKTKAKYNNLVFTLGGGYVFKLTDWLYLNPWAAGHCAVSGTGEKACGGKTYKPARFLSEVSLKIGVIF